MIEHMLQITEIFRDDMNLFADRIVSNGIIDYAYNPLSYAWEPHRAYLEKSVFRRARTMLLGMNPGPHGMGQMGIPFAATKIVRDLLKIQNLKVSQPRRVHPRRPVTGLDWPKEEVSGTRLWGSLEEIYGSAEEIFSKVFLLNHCPLMLFSGERGVNVTPDKLGGELVKSMLNRCDEYLIDVVELLQIKTVVGIGKYAEKRSFLALQDNDVQIKSCWHPSPASPLANRNRGEDWKRNFRGVLPP